MQETVRDETYQGWASYPTWCVNLWLANDEGLYGEALELAADVLAWEHPTSEYWSVEESVRFNVADALKAWVTDDLAVQVDNGQGGTESASSLTGVHADLYGWALAQVAWNEIADAWIEQVNAQ